MDDTECWTVPQIGLAGTKDTELLKKLGARDINVFITIDGNLEYQQKISGRSFGVIAIRSASNRLEDLIPFVPQIGDALLKVKPGQVIRVP